MDSFHGLYWIQVENKSELYISGGSVKRELRSVIQMVHGNLLSVACVEDQASEIRAVLHVAIDNRVEPISSVLLNMKVSLVGRKGVVIIVV